MYDSEKELFNWHKQITDAEQDATGGAHRPSYAVEAWRQNTLFLCRMDMASAYG